MVDWFTFTWLIFLLLLIPTGYAGFIGAPYAPTWKPIIKKAFREIRLGADDVLIDLGAGDGTVLLQASTLGARAIGYELSPIMWLVAWFRCLGKKNIKVKFGNFFHKQFPDATVIFLFLMPKHMEKMRRFLVEQKLPKAKFILVYAFPFPELQPAYVVHENKCAPLYIYKYEDLTLEH